MRPSRFLYSLTRLFRDVEAVGRGRAGNRLANRGIGRMLGRLTRGLWR